LVTRPEANTRVVIRASGMVGVQALCTAEDAVLLMNVHAQRTNHTLEEVATAVIDRSIRFGN
jgi:hypothetical protein